MPHAMPGVQDDDSTQGSGRGVDELRAAFFAHGGDYAIRYGIVFEQVHRHVRECETFVIGDRPLSLRYFDDLIHAAACMEGIDLAWCDLVEQHERALIRTCRERLEPDDAIVFVRRLFAHLRRQREQLPGPETLLRGFDGGVSMRRWLRDLILDALDRHAPWEPERPIAEVPRLEVDDARETTPDERIREAAPRKRHAGVRIWDRQTGVGH